MSALSNYLEGALANHVLRNTPYTSPGTSIYIALYTSDPGEDNSGTEVSGTNYARVQCSAWDAPSNGMVDNTSDITFATAGAGGWGLVSHVGILDNSTGGNLLFYGALSQSKQIDQNDTFKFAAGALSVTLA